MNSEPSEPHLTRPIEQAASSSICLERTHVHRTDAEFRFGDPLLKATFDRCRITATVQSFIIRNAVLDADNAVLFQDGLAIPETISHLPKDFEARINWDALEPLPGGEDYVMGYMKAAKDYQHWLTQCLPAIDSALRREREGDVRLIVARLATWQKEFLTILGYDQTPQFVIRPGAFYSLPQIEYAQYLNGTIAFEVSTGVYETMRRVLDRIRSTRETYPILFVFDPSPHYGEIENADEVVSYFRRIGVGVVDRQLTVVERINLFRNARVVIGAVGEGLTDILFTSPGTLLWEWMPRHYQNASFNRLAQTAKANYWADVFESAPGSTTPRPWSVDLDLVKQRMAEISGWLATKSAKSGTSSHADPLPPPKPLRDLMVAFESLGDNCEFGLLQKQVDANPLGLLRWAGVRLERLLAALDRNFEGVGDIENVAIIDHHEEYLLHEMSLDTRMHTFKRQTEMDAEDLRQRMSRQLVRLRSKILEDLATGEKIWVWRELHHADPARIAPLLERLRRLGPNRLLWVSPADDSHARGTIERLAPDFIRGFVERLAPYEHAQDSDFASWFEVCQAAYDVWHPQHPAQAGPVTAMDMLRDNPAAIEAPPAPTARKMRRWPFWWPPGTVPLPFSKLRG